jgi:hypothetical protein
MISIMIPITKHIAYNIQKHPKLKNYYTKNMFKLRVFGFTSILIYDNFTLFSF